MPICCVFVVLCEVIDQAVNLANACYVQLGSTASSIRECLEHGRAS